MCTNCGKEVTGFKVEDAIKEWNARPTEDELRGLLEEGLGYAEGSKSDQMPREEWEGKLDEWCKRTREVLSK